MNALLLVILLQASPPPCAPGMVRGTVCTWPYRSDAAIAVSFDPPQNCYPFWRGRAGMIAIDAAPDADGAVFSVYQIRWSVAIDAEAQQAFSCPRINHQAFFSFGITGTPCQADAQ